MKAVVVTFGLFALVGCAGTSGDEPVEQALDPPVEVPATTADPTHTPDGKTTLARSMLGEQDLGDWSVRMAYDLGMLRMLVLTRPSDANPVTVAQLTAPAPGVSEDGMAAVFAGAQVVGPHPFELLGYDHIQPRSNDVLATGGRELPRLEFSWLRVDPDTGERESGRGTAIWLHCGATATEAKAIDARWLVLASETQGTEHDALPVSELAGRLRVCSP